MTNTKKLFEPLDEIDAPDRWPQISERIEGRSGSRRSVRFAVALGATILVTGGIVVGLIAAFQPRTPEVRVGQSPSPTPVADVHLGEMTQLDIGLKEGSVSSMAYGFASVWVSGHDNDGEFLSRVDPGTNEVSARIPAVSSNSIAFADDAVWVAGSGTTPDGDRGTVVQRIDPASNEIVQTIGLAGSSAFDLVATEGALWVTVFHDLRSPAEVVRVDQETGEVLARIPLQSVDARDLVAAGGGIWVREMKVTHVAGGGLYEGYSYSRIDPATNQVVATSSEFGMASSDGNQVWGTQTVGADSGLVHFDPVTGQQLGSAVEMGRLQVLGVEDPGVWVVREAGGTAYLERFDPVSMRVDVSIPGLAPMAMSFSESEIWALNSDGTLSRIQLHE